MGPLRPVDGPDARHAVLEAMSPEAGHVIIYYFHLAAAEGWILKQVQLVIWAILGVGSRSEWAVPTLGVGVGRCGEEFSDHTARPTTKPIA